MTRIFDALRKSRSHRSESEPMPAPAPATGPQAVPAAPTRPIRPARVDPGLAPRPLVLPQGMNAELPEDVLREMTTLRVSLEAALLERVPRAVMLVSAQGGEGTSTVAMQLALTLAQDTRIRTLMIDLHARRPAHGSDAAIPTVAHEGTVVAHLDLLPFAEYYRGAGVIPPAEARTAIESFGAAYDWIVIDGPPVLESPDSATLAAVADGVVVVVQANRAKRPVLTRAVDLLRKAGARPLGSVLNRRRLEIPEFIYRRI